MTLMGYLILFGAASIVTLVWYALPSGRKRSAHAFARRVDLALDPTVEAAVTARLVRTGRVGLLSGVGAGIVTAWTLDATAGVLESPYAILAVLAGFFAGNAVGSGALGWWEARRPVPADAPRIARAETPTHADYVAGHERWGAWGAAAVSALLAAGLAMIDSTGFIELGDLPVGLMLGAVLVPAAAAGVEELVARRLIDRRQVAATPLELAWDDALRAHTLRDMITVPLVAGIWAPFLVLSVISDGLEGGWPANQGVGLVSGLVLILLLAAGGMGVVSIALRPARHFRSRLWPSAPVPGGTGGAGADGGAGTGGGAVGSAGGATLGLGAR